MNNNNNVSRMILGIIAGARTTSTRSDAKTGKTTTREILSAWHAEIYLLNANGETVRHFPLAHYLRSKGIDIPTGARDNMVKWVFETARRLNFGVKPYIVRDYATACANLKGRMEKRAKRMEKTIEAGEKAFMDKATENARNAWEKLPENLEALKDEIANFNTL